MNIVPLFENVVLTKIKPQKTSGIILPSSDTDKPDLAQVHAVGSGVQENGVKVEMALKVGDQVLFNKYAGSEFVLNGETFILIKQTDILAIIQN